MVYHSEQVSEESLRAVMPLKTEGLYRQASALAESIPRPSLFKTAIIALICGAIGVGIGFGALTMYQDHLKVTAMWEYMVKQSQAQAAKNPPATAPPTTPSK